jgi:hypothetical protein
LTRGAPADADAAPPAESQIETVETVERTHALCLLR